MEFFIDIKKKLYDFQLHVKIHAQEEIVGILGASGSGKSMLLRCIAGLVKPDEGKIIINGKTFFDSEKKINLSMRERKVGFLFQDYALFPNMTIEENIAFGLDHLSKSERKARVASLLRKYSLTGIEKRYPTQISGGQKQRVALARAVAVDPDILLLDEPFSALDVHLRNHMMKEMAVSLTEFKGLTLFVTHNREEAYQLSNYIAVFNTGQIEVFGQKDMIFSHPNSVEVAKITGCKNIVSAKKVANDRVTIPDWGVTLKTDTKIEAETGHIGIRANQVKLYDEKDVQKENCLETWIADEIDGLFRTTLYLKIGSPPDTRDDFHILCEIGKEERRALDDLTQPYSIQIDPKHIFFVTH